MEAFFGTPQGELIARRVWVARLKPKMDNFASIGAGCNPYRQRFGMGHLSPVASNTLILATAPTE